MTYSIRRCKTCNFKSHRMYWEENKICPVCSSVEGFEASSHGGLIWEKILEARALLEKNGHAIEVDHLTRTRNERHY